MILTQEHIKSEIELIKRYSIIKYQYKKEFEIKILDNSSYEYLIIDNNFISKKPLKLQNYIPLCSDIINKLLEGYTLNQLSMQ